jgi:hypothetical protein
MLSSNRKKIGYILIALAVILLAVIIYLFVQPNNNFLKNLFNGGKKGVLTEEEQKEEFEKMIEERKNNKVYTFDQTAEDNRAWEEDDFKQIARFFAERFGSFSNHSDYGNIEDLRSLMSSKMKTWADSYVANLRDNRENSEGYYGITTKVLLEPEIINPEKSSSIDVMVETQRQEITADGSEKNYNQNIKVVFVNEGGKWLVDSAHWQ